MNDEESNARWQTLVSLQEEVGFGDASQSGRRGEAGRVRSRSEKAARFAEALSVSTTWSGISEARNRHAA